MSSDPFDPCVTPRPADPRGMSTHELRSARTCLRRERERIHAEAIAHGPSHALCLRLNALEVEERALLQEEQRRRAGRRGHPVRGILAAMRLAG